MLRDDGQVRRSSFCSGGECVSVSLDGDDVVLAAHGSRVRIGRDEWAAFLAGAKAGEFDLPAALDP